MASTRVNKSQKVRNPCHSLGVPKYRIIVLVCSVIFGNFYSNGLPTDAGDKLTGLNGLNISSQSNLQNIYEQLLSKLAKREEDDKKFTDRLNNVSAEISEVQRRLRQDETRFLLPANRMCIPDNQIQGTDSTNKVILKGRPSQYYPCDINLTLLTSNVDRSIGDEIEKKMADVNNRTNTIVLEIVRKIKYLETADADLHKKQSTETLAISSEVDKIRGRLDRNENTTSRLDGRVSSAYRKIEDIAQRTDTVEAEGKSVKDEMAQKVKRLENVEADLKKELEDTHAISSEVGKMRGRLDRNENIASQLDGKVSSAGQRIENIAQRIGAAEAESRNLRNELTDIRNNIPPEMDKVRGRLDQSEGTISELNRKTSVANQQIQDIILGSVPVQTVVKGAGNNYDLPEGSGKVIFKLRDLKSTIDDVFQGGGKVVESYVFLSFYSKRKSYHMKVSHVKYDTTGLHVILGLVPGNYDASLTWPFPGDVILTFFHQSGPNYAGIAALMCGERTVQVSVDSGQCGLTNFRISS